MKGLSWQRCVVSLLLQLMSLIVKAWWIQDVRRWLFPLAGAQIASFSQWQIPYGLLDHSQSRVVESVVFYHQSLTGNAAEGQVWLCTLQRGGGQNDGKRRWNTKQVPRRISNSKRSERERERCRLLWRIILCINGLARELMTQNVFGCQELQPRPNLSKPLGSGLWGVTVGGK